MRKYSLLFLLIFAALVGCNKDSGTATTDPGNLDTNGSTIAKGNEPDKTVTEPGPTEPDPGKTNPPPDEKSKPTPDPHAINPKQHAPKDDPTKVTTATPTKATFLGEYKMTHGLGVKARMFVLDLKEGGVASLNITGVDPNVKPDKNSGKWSEKGGQLIIEWPDQAPMVFTLKGREMVSESFDPKKWPGKRVIFYKRI